MVFRTLAGPLADKLVGSKPFPSGVRDENGSHIEAKLYKGGRCSPWTLHPSWPPHHGHSSQLPGPSPAVGAGVMTRGRVCCRWHSATAKEEEGSLMKVRARDRPALQQRGRGAGSDIQDQVNLTKAA